MKFLKGLLVTCLTLLASVAIAQKKYVIKQNLPIGKKYDFSLVSDQIITQKIGTQNIKLTQNIGTDYTFDIRNGDDQEKDIKVIYNRIYMKSVGMGNTMVMDSNDPDTSKLNSFRGLKGAEFSMVMTPNGSIKSIVGIDRMLNNLVAKMNVDSLTATRIKASLSQQFSIEGMKQTMESSLKIYPDKPVKIGDSWTVDTKMQLTMPIETLTKYTLTDVKDGIAYLKVSGTLLSKGTFESMGNKIDTDLSGTNNGDAELNIESGLILNSHLRIELAGKMQVAGQSVDFELQGINKIVGKQL